MNPPLQADPHFQTGIDVGGTKVHIMDSGSAAVHRYSTTDFPNIYAVLDDYFAKQTVRPGQVAIAIAGPRDDETGIVRMTNCDWPQFDPREATKRYPGTSFTTANDMIGTAAGVLQEAGVELKQLKPGTPAVHGTKLIMSLSTGIGAAAAVWDSRSNQYVFLAGEGGHIGFQPKTSEEANYLAFLQSKYSHVSAELALSGKHGIESLVTHTLEHLDAPELAAACQRAQQAGRPVGAVLLEFALEAGNSSGRAAQTILSNLGAMAGSVVRDLTVAFNATGGVYLTGSVSLALAEYFAEKTDFVQRFIHPGAVHDERLERIPINLVMDPNVAVVGALALAQDI